MPRGTMKMARRGRPSALAMLSVSDLMREVERRRNVLSDLLNQRAQLESDMAALDAEIGELESLTGGGGGRGRGRRRGRPPGRRGPAPGHRRAAKGGKAPGTRRGRGSNEQSLVSALHGLLRGKTLGVAEMSDAVKKAGYKTSSPNFRTIVNAALITNPDKFKRIARGQYTSK